MEREWSVCGRSGCVFGAGETVVYAVLSREDGRELFRRVGTEIALVTVENVRWDDDLTPWPAKAIFRGRPDFGGGAENLLEDLKTASGEIERQAGLSVRKRMIAGYSLAGLFGVYAAMNSQLFDAAACVSGSMWYEGFCEWMKTAPYTPKEVCFSVGDREKLGRNAAFRTIEDKTLEAAEILRLRGAKTYFGMRPGGHFDDPMEWLAQGVCRFLDE